METMRGERERAQDLKYRLKEKTKREGLVVEEDGEDEEEEEEDWLGSGEDDKKRRTLRRSSTGNGGGGVSLSPPKCQVEKCTVVLSEAKKYHRRHKVCEIHFKASFVIVAGIRQRFCQQCSRFHELSEFDESKRSCRSRLAGHNERRRKNSSESTHGEGSSRKGTGPIIASRLTKVGGC